MKNGRETLWLFDKLILLLCCTAFFAFDAKAAPTNSRTVVMRYLSRFGYLPPMNRRTESTMTDEAMSKAISEFQAFVGMETTGIMDTKTNRMMHMPRCGVKDKFGPNMGGRSKRWALYGRPWSKRNLTYMISKYSDGQLDRKTTDQVIAEAFAKWAEYVDLSFTPTSDRQVDIEIKFARTQHGDSYPFDGRGRILAHAFNPDSGGDLHFDDDEEWTVETVSHVALHEMGHSLGLSHSSVKESTMFPFYRPTNTVAKLHNDDIKGIQAQYKAKIKVQDSDICKDTRIDAIFESPDGYIYAFKGKHYTRMMDDGIYTGYPKLIAERWRELPGNMDAALAYNGKTYFFKGSKYWTYVGDRMESGPKEIRKGFPGIPDNVDTVTVWTGDGKIYFFKGTEYWRFEPTQRPQVKSTYPRHISDWAGLPNKLDASVAFRGDNYFFAGDEFYRFNDRRSRVYSSSPEKTRPDLFGCDSHDKSRAI